MTRPTPSQVVSALSVLSTAVLAVLQGNHEAHTPVWVFALLAGVISVCRSLSPINSGGESDPKAAGGHEPVDDGG